MALIFLRGAQASEAKHRVCEMGDDSHVAKFIRALKNGKLTSKAF